MIRRAVYTGSFYDSRPEVLIKQFELWFAHAILPSQIIKPRGIICPHAGYAYSGSCAAHSYKLISRFEYKTAIILHPCHRANHFDFCISPYDGFETPLGKLKLDQEIAQAFRDKGIKEIDFSYDQNEHSMEVQLPFLKYVNPDMLVVPVIIGKQNAETSLRLSKVCEEITKEHYGEVLIIASSDLSHYHPSEQAEMMDRQLIDYVTAFDTEALYRNIIEHKVEACGFAAIMALMHLAKSQHNKTIMELNYTHSGHASKDFDQVVGYFSAGMG